jgi:hypothetical protein
MFRQMLTRAWPLTLVLTNYRVVDGYDETADVALVQLDGASGLDQVRLDDGDDGDDVVGEVTAIGNAGGRGSLVTVTAVEQQIATSPTDAESLDGLIETDTAAVPGYSGGPMLDAAAEAGLAADDRSRRSPARGFRGPTSWLTRSGSGSPGDRVGDLLDLRRRRAAGNGHARGGPYA